MNGSKKLFCFGMHTSFMQQCRKYDKGMNYK